MKFRIYYADGSTYSGDPYYVNPPTGVQVIATEEPAAALGYVLTTSKDAFYYKEGRWWGCDEMGLFDYLMQYVGPKAVLFGRTMSRNEDYWAIVTRAKKEGINV